MSPSACKRRSACHANDRAGKRREIRSAITRAARERIWSFTPPWSRPAHGKFCRSSSRTDPGRPGTASVGDRACVAAVSAGPTATAEWQRGVVDRCRRGPGRLHGASTCRRRRRVRSAASRVRSAARRARSSAATAPPWRGSGLLGFLAVHLRQVEILELLEVFCGEAAAEASGRARRGICALVVLGRTSEACG